LSIKSRSRQIIHLGINFITIPAPSITHQSYLAFQQEVISSGLDFLRAENPQNQIILTREAPSPIRIAVSMLESQVGQVLIVAPNPKEALELFIQEVEAALGAFETVWPAQNRQIIKSDGTIRELHETTGKHAFQELWEKRLGQPSQPLKTFGRPIRGGGLRFVMDPLQDEDDPVQIEVKIESFLRDTTKIFVETQFIWPRPTAPGSSFDARERLFRMNSYIEHQVQAFLRGDIK
jgi:hypothetical protein